MKFVIICAFLALAKYGYAVTVCNQEVPTNPSLIVSCEGDKMLKYPNYNDLTTYYTCSGGQPVLQRCSTSQYFCYYRQNCGDCNNFIVPPDCEFFAQKTNSKCSAKVVTTTTRTPLKPITTTPKTPTTPKPAVTRPATTTPRPKPGAVPTPPGPSTGIPMPPMVVTPVPGIPTPPNEDVTPPSIPGTPPMLTTVPSM